MKKKKKIFIIFLILLIILLYALNSVKYYFLQEDLIFFQFFNSINKSEGNSNYKEKNNNFLNSLKTESQSTTENVSLSKVQLSFNVKYGQTKLKDLNLLQTINNKTLVHEKIAPGTKGDFNITLKSKETLNYKISFKSENEKPSNLQFYILENNKKYNSLEELGNDLNGILSENREKIIKVNWEWYYEIDKQNNEKDTIEAKKIREYNFLIYVQGY